MSGAWHFLDLIEILSYTSGLSEFSPRLRSQRRKEETCAPSPQPSARVESGPDFSIFFARNPLKRLDSEKEMKGNERTFSFISFRQLSFSFVPLALRLHLRTRQAARRPRKGA